MWRCPGRRVARPAWSCGGLHRVDEFHGNDFSGVDMVDPELRCGIDLSPAAAAADTFFPSSTALFGY